MMSPTYFALVRKLTHAERVLSQQDSVLSCMLRRFPVAGVLCVASATPDPRGELSYMTCRRSAECSFTGEAFEARKDDPKL